MTTEPCYCSEEDGPCETHAQVLVVREGASLHTADELLSIFVDDAVGLGAELSPYGRDVQTRVEAALAANESLGVAWLNDDGLLDELVTVAYQMENELATLGMSVWREDGYVISRITGGPLAGE